MWRNVTNALIWILIFVTIFMYLVYIGSGHKLPFSTSIDFLLALLLLFLLLALSKLLFKKSK